MDPEDQDRKVQWVARLRGWFAVWSVPHSSVWVPFLRLLKTGVHLEANE